MIQIVQTEKQLKEFIDFVKTLYKDDPHYVFPIFSALRKELRHEVLETKKYTALISKRDNKVVGRLLYTIDISKSRKSNIGYYSFYDVIDDISVSNELFQTFEQDMKNQGITYVEGTFTPYDPDTRRGILISGFDIDPTFLTSYNKSYYQNHLEALGFSKAADTFSLKADICEDTTRKLQTIQKFFQSRFRVQIDSISYEHMDRDIEDIHQVLSIASTEINYQDPPTKEMIAKVAKSMRMFVDESYIKIAREIDTNDPVGFCFVLPDFNQVLKATKGKIKIIPFFRYKHYIHTARGIMQYVVPKYQNTGLIGVMFKTVYDNFERNGITRFEAGTILEENMKSISAFSKFGGQVIKTYRLFGKEL